MTIRKRRLLLVHPGWGNQCQAGTHLWIISSFFCTECDRKRSSTEQLSRGRILGGSPDKTPNRFPPCYSLSPLSFAWSFLFIQFHIVSPVQLLYTVKEKGGTPDRKPHSLPYGLRNPYWNLKFENSKDYAQKSLWNCTFMNSLSGQYWFWLRPLFIFSPAQDVRFFYNWRP